MSSRKPFIFLFTGDEFTRRAKIESLLDQLIPAPLRSTNLSRVFADDLDWTHLVTQASTPSLMGGVQVFWIAQAEKLKKSDLPAFETYCSRAQEQSYFIFEAEELSNANPLVKLAVDFGKHTHTERESSEGLNLMKAKLKRSGKTFTPEAWQILEERLGSSLRLMDIALDQLILYAEGATIDEQSVKQLSGEFLKYEPFDLTEALARKDIAEALKIFHFFYEASNDMTSMVGLIHWQLKRIWQAKRILERGGRPDEIGRTLKIPPFRLHSFLAQAKRFNLETVEKLLERLWRVDWNSKKGSGDETVAMEMFFAEVGAG
ncbi:MAG: DNA polymerase III subunit delta [Candidatus Omnitrophica bacterium]|nr:DNA polymerase III subunit delta [Candidatus Omnitrophota bacterium]